MTPIWHNLLLLDRTNELEQLNPLYAFALDELLCRSTGNGGPALCHIWRHPQAFILGPRDSRLPYAKQAMAQLEAQGTKTIVRNSGGAAVPLDAGVVNISLILPNTHTADYHFHSDFEMMYTLIREALQSNNKVVAKGEIAGSYCPGDFDLSIDGLKFCGIAQRRQRKATIIQAFVIIEGSGQERAELVRSFYATASGGDTTLSYPTVRTDRIASLQELTDAGPQSVQTFTHAVQQIIRSGQTDLGSADTASKPPLPGHEEIEAMLSLLQARYGS